MPTTYKNRSLFNRIARYVQTHPVASGFILGGIAAVAFAVTLSTAGFFTPFAIALVVATSCFVGAAIYHNHENRLAAQQQISDNTLNDISTKNPFITSTPSNNNTHTIGSKPTPTKNFNPKLYSSFAFDHSKSPLDLGDVLSQLNKQFKPAMNEQHLQTRNKFAARYAKLDQLIQANPSDKKLTALRKKMESVIEGYETYVRGKSKFKANSTGTFALVELSETLKEFDTINKSNITKRADQATTQHTYKKS